MKKSPIFKIIIFLIQLLLIFNISSCNHTTNSSYSSLEEIFINSFDSYEILKTFISDDITFVIHRNKSKNVSYDICYVKDNEWHLASDIQKNSVELADCNGVVEHVKIGDKNYVIAMSSLHKSNEFLICDTENNLFEAYSYTSPDDIKTAVFFTQVENFNDSYYLYFMSKKIDFVNKSACIDVNKTNTYTGIKNWKEVGVSLNLDYEIEAVPAPDKKTAQNISDGIISQIQTHKGTVLLCGQMKADYGNEGRRGRRTLRTKKISRCFRIGIHIFNYTALCTLPERRHLVQT